MATRRRRTKARAPSQATSGASPPLILIADDNHDQRHLYGGYFLMQGFRVEVARDGEEAYQRAVELMPDAIVMDLTMPFVDGYEATRRLKGRPATAHIPIIACTAHAFGPPVERALQAGCDAYVVKPCLPQDLLREIRNLLARSSEGQRRQA